MCFSAEADVVAGVVVAAIGIDGICHVRRRAQLPLASLPLVLAVHQLVEAFVWWGLQGDVAHGLGRVAIWVYLVLAFGVLPVMMPVAIAALEPPSNRYRMAPFVALGGVVAAVLLYSVVRGPIVAGIDGYHIAYQVDLWHGGWLVALYVLATCGPLLCSSWRHVRWFGALNLAGVAALAWLSQNSLISLWCLWAAVTSISIALHLRFAPSPRRRRVALVGHPR